jgi:hypothetical protein
MHVVRKVLAFAGVVVFSLSATSSLAHHSMAMFDITRNVTLEGTVKELQWTNPHVWIQLLVPDPATGKETEWSIESDSPNVLTRRGWTRKSIKAGDKAVAVIHPLKSIASNGGSLASVSVNGQRIGAPGPRPPAETK